MRLTIERLKAENASLLGQVDQLVGDVQAITQDYTNAAGALRWIADWDKQPAMMQVARTLHYDMAAKARAALSGEAAAGPAEPPSEVVPEPLPTRASLLESLREACKACHAPENRADGLCAKCQRDRGDGELAKKRKVGGLLSEAHKALATAKQRAEAAEKRKIELQGALRAAAAALHEVLCVGLDEGQGLSSQEKRAARVWRQVSESELSARAALHDEERSARVPWCNVHEQPRDLCQPESHPDEFGVVGDDEKRSAPPQDGARMDAPDGPICWCGKPSRHESGWCGVCEIPPAPTDSRAEPRAAAPESLSDGRAAAQGEEK